MFDPDDLKKELAENLKKASVRHPLQNTPNLTKQNTPVTTMSEKDRLRYYLKECSHTQEGYGFKMVKGKLTIVDIAKIERFDSETKAILRELYLELK